MGGSRRAVLAGERDWLLARIAEKPDLTLRAIVAELAARDVRVSLCERGGFPLFGTPDHIVAQLDKVSAAGIDGMLLTWFDYADGIARWNQDVLPLLEQADLRRGTGRHMTAE